MPCTTGSGPSQVLPPSCDQISQTSAFENPCLGGPFVTVVQTVPSGVTCGSRYESQRLPLIVGSTRGVVQSVCVPSGRASACDSKITDGLRTKTVYMT